MSAGDPGALEVLWTGDREVAVFKPAGLSSERPGPSDPASGESAIARARRQFGWPDAQLPHRLDRPTAGILLIAADRARVADHAREQQEGRWTKWYLARIPTLGARGVRAESIVGMHRAYLRREGRLARSVRSGGDPARLEVLAVAAAGRDAHALIRLDTGRFHQIRVMLAELGLPLVGDRDYGGASRAEGLQLISAALVLSRGAATARIEVPNLAARGIAPELVSALAAAVSATPADPATSPGA